LGATAPLADVLVGVELSLPPQAATTTPEGEAGGKETETS